MTDSPYHPEAPPRSASNPDRISKNSLWIFIGQTGSAFLSFIAVFLMTRYLGPEKYGHYSTALSLALMLLPLADLGFDLYMTRIISADVSSLSRELSRTLSIKLVLGVLFMAAIVTAALILGYEPFMIAYVALLGVSLAISSLTQSLVGAIRAIRRMRYESLSLMLGRASTTLGIFLLIAARADLMLIILSYLAGSVISFAAAYYFLRRETGGLGLFFGLSGWKERLAGAFPFGITVILTAVYFKIDTLILYNTWGASWVGFYNSAQNLINGSMMLASPLVVAIFPAIAAIYETRREEAGDIFRRGLNFILLLGLPLGVGTALMAGSVINFVYGPEFSPAVPLLTILAAKIPVVFATLLIGNSLGAIGYQKRVAVVSGINVVFNVVLNLLLIPRYGAMAAAAITLGTETLGLVQYAFITRGKLKLAFLPQLLKMMVCCLAGAAGFILLEGPLGPWPAAGVFAVVYTALVFLFRLISVSVVKDMLLSRSAA